MHNPTLVPTTLDQAHYEAWVRMIKETRLIAAGHFDKGFSPDLPHVSAFLVAHTHYLVALEAGGQNAAGRREAHKLRIAAEAQYAAAILEEELERVELATNRVADDLSRLRGLPV